MACPFVEQAARGRSRTPPKGIMSPLRQRRDASGQSVRPASTATRAQAAQAGIAPPMPEQPVRSDAADEAGLGFGQRLARLPAPYRPVHDREAAPVRRS